MPKLLDDCTFLFVSIQTLYSIAYFFVRLAAGLVNLAKSTLVSTTTPTASLTNNVGVVGNAQSAKVPGRSPPPPPSVHKSQSTIVHGSLADRSISSDVNSSSGFNRRTSLSAFANTHTTGVTDVHTRIDDKLEVYVAFGKLAPKTENDKKIHVTYETCVSSVATNVVLLSTVCAFDGYRQLYKDLIAAGCAMKSIEPFPPTYAQSSWGISLSKDQLAERYFAGL
jgi:hypothetical protein